MRTTVDIPDELFRRAKAAAALEGKSLKLFVADALASKLRRQDEVAAERPTRVTLPLVRSDKPGELRLGADEVGAALEAEDLDAVARR